MYFMHILIFASVEYQGGVRMPASAVQRVPAIPQQKAIVERHFHDATAGSDDVHAMLYSSVAATHVARHWSVHYILSRHTHTHVLYVSV